MPSSRSSRSARRTVFGCTSSTAAMSFDGGRRCPGTTSPFAMSRPFSAATHSWRCRLGSRRPLTSVMVTSRVSPSCSRWMKATKPRINASDAQAVLREAAHRQSDGSDESRNRGHGRLGVHGVDLCRRRQRRRSARQPGRERRAATGVITDEPAYPWLSRIARLRPIPPHQVERADCG